MKQASLEARAGRTVSPSVPSACPARLPHGLSPHRGASLALESPGDRPGSAIPLGCSRSAKLDSGQLGQRLVKLPGSGEKQPGSDAKFF